MENNYKGINSKIKYIRTVAAFLMATVAILLLAENRKQQQNTQDIQDVQEQDAWEQLGADDKKIANVYAEIYEVPESTVAEMKQESGDWDKVYARLEDAYFTIGETEKYQMAEEGYLIEDLYEAEVLARKTGKRAIDLAKAKGKASEGKSWSDVLGEEDEEKTIEEKLGLTAQQVKKLKKKKYAKDERIDIALLCFNRQESFPDIMKELEAGKTIRELKEETEHGK